MATKEHTFQDQTLLSILDREAINGLMGNKKMLKKAAQDVVPHSNYMRLCTPIKSYGFLTFLNLTKTYAPNIFSTYITYCKIDAHLHIILKESSVCSPSIT